MILFSAKKCRLLQRVAAFIIVGLILIVTLSGTAQNTRITDTESAVVKLSSPKSILTNGGFEEEINSLPVGWQQGRQVPGVEYIWTPAVAHEGKACVVLKKTVQKYFPISEWFQAVPHTGTASNLKVSAWVKAQKVYKAIIDVQFLGHDGKWSHQWASYIGAKNPGDPPANHDWKQYTDIVSIPAGTKEVKVALQIYGPGVVGFDKVSAEYVEQGATQERPVSIEPTAQPAQLLLTNPSFESGDSMPTGWLKGQQIPGVQYIWDKGIAYRGHASLCLKKTVNRYFPIAQWYQSVPKAGTASKLRVSAWVKSHQTYKAIVDVQFIGGTNTWSHQWAAYIGAKNIGDPPANHDWKQYSGVVSIPAGTKQINIALQIYGPGTVWFDNVSAEYIQ